MKHIILTIAIVLAALTGFAQEEVAIEQVINQKINKLEINSGWDVHLIHNEADTGYRIAIVTTEDLAAFACNVQLCNLKDEKLTIFENTQLPKGTVVEIEGPITFGQIALLDRSEARADYVAAMAQEDLKNISLGRNSNFYIQNYHITESKIKLVLEIWDNAKLTIDTISGEGDAVVKVNGDADFKYGHCTPDAKIKLYEYVPTLSYYRQKDRREIKGKEVDGELVTTNRRKMWEQTLNFDGRIGIQQGNTPKDANSPLLQNSTLSVKIGFNTSSRLSNHWRFSSGLMFSVDKKTLSHQVKYEDNELVVIDGQEEFQRNSLKNLYLGATATFYYYLGKREMESIALDFYCAGLMREWLSTTTDPTKLFARKYATVDNIFNPWKLEVGISFNTQSLGFIHGIRVFANILPEYAPGVIQGEIRSVGIEIKL